MAEQHETLDPSTVEPDVTITSYMDTPEQMRQALGMPPDEDDGDHVDGGDEPDTQADAADGDADETTDETADDATEAASAPDLDAQGFEAAPERETRRQRVERLERNLQRALGATTARTAALERQIETLTAALERASVGGGSPAKAATSPATATPAVEVKPFTFPTWDTYADEHPDATEDDYRDARADARADWKRETALAERRTQHQAEAAKAVETEVATIVATKQAGITAFKAKHADFDDVLAASTAVLTPGLHAYASRAGEVGAAMIYHLSRPENAALAKTFATMRTNSPEEMRALVRLEESPDVKALLKGTRPSGTKRAAGATRQANDSQDAGTDRASRPRPRSNPPPEPLDTQVPGRESVSTVPLDSMDTDTYIQTMNARDPRRRQNAVQARR